MSLKWKLLTLLLTLSVSVCMADSPTGEYFSGTEIECPGIPRTAEATVIACNKMAYENADRELNAIYKQLMASADKDEQEILRNMQRAWIDLKDAQCKLVGYYYSDAPHTEKWTTRCEAIMTIRRVKELKELGTGTSTPQNDEEHYSKVGDELMANDAVGFLKYGLMDSAVLNALGEPGKRSKLETMEYDGDKHQTWYYPAKGIELGMVGAKNKQRIETIKIYDPCTLITTRGIGLGSTKEDVISAYKNEINPSESNADSYILVAGTIYGGILFEIKGNHVSSIFIGAGAE